jgi:hypothetical protein
MPGMGPMPGMGGPQQSGPQPKVEPSASPKPSATTLFKAVKVTQLQCQRAKIKKTVIANVCPSGYKKIGSKKVTVYVEINGAA